VTGSSYQEQDRLNSDLDDIAGSFSGGSVATNRAMNETVGGMQLMSEDSGNVTDYQLKVFSESWVRGVMHQCLLMEKFYESDPRRLQAAGYGAAPELALQALRMDMTVSMAVGFGATNPQKQVEKLAFGLETVTKFMPQMIQKFNPEEILKEVFGALGYQDGRRFFNDEKMEDPRVAELTKQLQEAQQMLQTKQLDSQTRIQVENIRQQGQMQRDTLKYDTQRQIAYLQQQIDYIDQQIDAELNDIKRGELQIAKDAFVVSKQEKELQFATSERDRMSDLLMNNKYGMAPGIDDQPGRG